MNTLGWIGATLLSFCPLPEVIYAYKRKDSHLSWWFLALWGAGEVCIAIPVLFRIKEPFLILNYLLNILFISIIVYYKAKKKLEEMSE